MKTQNLLLIVIALLLLTCCDKDDDNNNNNVDTTRSVSGTISYNGLYSGTNTTIYIVGYMSNSKAVGAPDFTTSISAPGSYTLDLDDYSGDLYVSAFMDIDNSGSSSGATANSTMTEGVYGDPTNCYGDFLFNNGGPTKITVDGEETDIDMTLLDGGVIKASFSDAGHCTVGVISNNIISEEFLHHKHFDITGVSDTVYFPVPVRDNWYCKVKFDNLTQAQLLSTSVSITVNGITEVNF